eukprot:6200656-Pleurochrysis_carterae.AAC.2
MMHSSCVLQSASKCRSCTTSATWLAPDGMRAQYSARSLAPNGPDSAQKSTWGSTWRSPPL